MSFGCTGCGVCCKRIGLVLGKVNFPYRANEKGACEKLTEDNKCSVYESRPDICRIDKMAQKAFLQDGVPHRKYYLKNAVLCNAWMREDGIDKKFLIDETQYK